MRDYIFHGKRIDTGEWVEGYYCKAEKLDKSGYEHFIIEESADGASHLVILESVGQYTGMKDVGDQNIFEGNIMETAICGLKHHKGVVEFTDGAFGLRCTDGSAFFLCFVAGNYRTIGNIFENADLLEE